MNRLLLKILFLYLFVSSVCGQNVLNVIQNTNDKSDYHTIKEALLQSKSGDTIRIFTGKYAEYSLNIPDGVTVIGVGKVEINGELPATATTKESDATSTIDFYNNGRLENLTVTAKNMRYPVHSDFSKGNTRQDIVNCRFIHFGNSEIYNYRKQHNIPEPNSADEVMKVQSAWGAGTMSGDKRYFTGCYFESPIRAFSTHNNVEFDKKFGASLTVLENCKMVSHGIDFEGKNIGFCAPVVIQSLKSNAPDKVILTDCDINGYLCFQNAPTIQVDCNAKNLKVIFHTVGSMKKMVDQTDSLYNYLDWYPHIQGEISAFRNVGTKEIKRGQAVKKFGDGMALMTSADNPKLFFGVALQDVKPAYSGDVKFDGYIFRPYLARLKNMNLIAVEKIRIDKNGNFSRNVRKKFIIVSENQNIWIP